MARCDISPTSEIAIRRYYQNKSGMGIPEIAERDGVGEQAVRDAIQAVEVYRERHKIENVQTAFAAVVLQQAAKVSTTLSKTLTAKTEIEVGGKKRKVDDLDMQLKGVAEVRTIMQTIQPKGPAHQTNVGVAVGVHSDKQRVATGTYSGMEDMLADIMKEQAAQPSPEQRQLKGATLEASKEHFEEVEVAAGAEGDDE